MSTNLSNSRYLAALLLLIVLLIGAACGPQAITPPRLATAEAVRPTAVPASGDVVFLPAPTATPGAQAPASATAAEPARLDVWINETSPEHRELAQTMARDFTERTGIDIAMQLVNAASLPALTHTAVLSGTLPDIILHPLEYTVAWSEDGILDTEAADSIVDQLGRSTFDQDALALVEVNGKSAAIPSDGYQQLLLYRTDWFEERGLDDPDNYRAMLRAAEALFDEESATSGLVVPTESNLVSTQRAFEQIALANGCELSDAAGEVRLLELACRDALDFYFSIINQYSPPGVQTDTSARNAFLDGRTGMILTTPAILPDLVRANRLNLNSGILTTISGNGTGAIAANLGNVTYLGVTPEADPEAAATFANYWFNEGYRQWLAVDSERKVPMRWGTEERPRLFIDAWGEEAVLEGESLLDIYGPEVVSRLREGIASSQRWGFRDGQGALTGRAYEELTFSVVLQEMLSGYFNTEKTLFEAYNRVIELVPDYAFPITPTPEPELD